MRTNKQGASRVRCGLALTAVGAMAVTALGFVPIASASLVPESPIPAGANITVFHNLDFVATSGWFAGERLRIEVLRNDVVIGSVEASAISGPEGVGLEVNHGPEGAPLPGDCWDGYTPDIRPLDTVRITHSRGTSAVVVDDITFSGPAEEEPLTEAVLVRGVALRADGTPIPVEELDSAEFRDGQLRGGPTSVVADPGGTVGGFVMRYEHPYTMDRNRDGLSPAQIKQSLLTSGGHAIGFGHVEPLPAEAMLVDGLDDLPGPALGCEESPAGARAIGSVSPSRINLSNAGSGLAVSGVTDGGTVDVTLSAGGVAVTQAADVDATTWSTQFTSAQLSGLHGTVTVTADHATDGPAGVNTRSLVRDVTAPAAPTVSPNGGAISGARSVFLSGGAGDRIFYTVGNGSQPAPAVAPSGAVSGTRFVAPFNVRPGQTVKAISVDAADNPSAVTTASFGQAASTPPPVGTPPPPGAGAGAILPLAPSIAKAKSGQRGGVKTATARWRAPQANGAVVDGYRVRAFKIRPGTSAEKVKAVRIGASRTRVEMVLPRGAYRFQVRASSAAGKGPWSARSNQVRSR